MNETLLILNPDKLIDSSIGVNLLLELTKTVASGLFTSVIVYHTSKSLAGDCASLVTGLYEKADKIFHIEEGASWYDRVKSDLQDVQGNLYVCGTSWDKDVYPCILGLVTRNQVLLASGKEPLNIRLLSKLAMASSISLIDTMCSSLELAFNTSVLL